MAQMSRDVAMSVQHADLSIQIVAEGVSWSPDVADDMIRRTTELWRAALMELSLYGIYDQSGEDLTEEELAELMKASGESEGDGSGE